MPDPKKKWTEEDVKADAALFRGVKLDAKEAADRAIRADASCAIRDEQRHPLDRKTVTRATAKRAVHRRKAMADAMAATLADLNA